MSPNDWYGLGFAFPPLVNPETGALGTVGDTEVVAQALRMLLRTAPGERLMRPDYGCDLRRFLFAPNDASTRRLIANEVTRAINLYEDRVRLTGIDVSADELEPAQVNLVVRYTLRRSGAPGLLSQAFRLDGGQD